MKTYIFRYNTILAILCILFIAVSIYAQDNETSQILDDAVVTVVGGGSFSPNSGIPQNPDDVEPGPKIVGGGGASVENDKIYIGAGMQDFGIVYSIVSFISLS